MAGAQREHLQLWQFVAAAPSAKDAEGAMKGKDGARSVAALRAVDIPTLQHKSANFVLHGPTQSGKTSLLFQRALSAAEAGKKAIFICPDKEKVHRKQPLLNSHMSKPKVSVLARVEIRYLRSREELLAYLCHAHMEKANVGFIGIDDFDSYWPRDADGVAVARLCAYLANAAEGLNCPAGVTMTLDPSSSTVGLSARMTLVRRWLPSLLSLNCVPLSPSETAQGTRSMEQSHSRAMPTSKRSKAMASSQGDQSAGCRTELSVQLTKFHTSTLVLYCLATGLNLVGAGCIDMSQAEVQHA